MHTWPLISWARYVLLAAVFIILIGIIPAVWFPLQLGKLAVFAVALLLTSILFLLGGGAGGVFGKRGTKAAFLVGLLPLAYLLSYAFSTDRSVGLLGYSIESDTIIFVLIGSLAFLFSFFLFRRFGPVRALLGSAFVAACAALIFQFISILFGTHILSQLFADPSVNLVGKWNDLGLLSGLIVLLLLCALELAPLSRTRRIIASCVMAVFVIFLALVQFPLVWGLLLAGSLALLLWSFLSRNKQEAHVDAYDRLRTLPWLPIAATLVSVLFLLWGALVQGGLIKVFPVSSLEVRPALSTTLDIVRASHGSSIKRFFVGTGPETFGNSWFLNKPVDINQTQFWNLDFNVGYSTFATALGTVGTVGALAWLVPLLLVLLGLIRVLRIREVFSAEEKALALALGFASVYLWAATFLYPPSENILLLAFILSGASFALSMKESQTTEAGKSRIMLLAFKGVLLACIVLLAFISFFVVRRYITEVHTNQGLYALQRGDIASALALADTAIKSEQTGDSLQFATLAGTASLGQIVQATSTPSTQVQQQFTTLAQQTISLGQQATVRNPNDYRAYLNLAKVYDLLASVGVDGAFDSALQMYTSAATHNPTNPEIPLDVAHLQSVHGDTKATTASLQQALTLKSDYTDAILFVVQLDVANKDIAGAITAAKAAVNSAPGVSSIWFELGLLYYSNNDTKDAITALEQALGIEPNYANAKYFLGLSYAAEKRPADAVQQFKDLVASNPDNAEVKLILANLEAGKPPFDGAQAPVTPAPQDRAQAPISQ